MGKKIGTLVLGLGWVTMGVTAHAGHAGGGAGVGGVGGGGLAATTDIKVVAERLRDRVAAAVLSVPTAVVVTADRRSFVEAIALTGGRVPVVFDDGTPEAREDIARLVRGLSAGRGAGGGAGGGAGSGPTVVSFKASDTAWPAEAGKRQELITGALHRAWKVSSADAYRGALRARAAGVLGVVVTSAADDASLAGLALAASRGQALVFVTPPADVSDEWTMAKALELQRGVVEQLRATGLSFEGLGDEIDTITLALTCAAKVVVKAGDDVPGVAPLVCKPGEYLALTDVIGRAGPGLAQRWAFAGQIGGPAARAIARAMGGIYCPGGTPVEAWVFDSYPGGPQFDEYAAGRTQRVLDAAREREPSRFGGGASFGGAAGATLSGWRAAILGREGARGLDANLLLVGTMGNWDFFQLRPGNASPGDVPLLRRPALVYFIHSWSLQFGDEARGVGGRWIGNGAYAYVGSVHEPFLAAFPPPALVSQRLVAGVPLGMAIRHDQAPLSAVWRVGLMGDPLVNLAQLSAGQGATGQGATDGARLIAGLGLAGAGASAGAVASGDGLAGVLKARDFAGASRLMVLLGRDADVSRLMAALLREQPKDVTQAVAREGALACFRAGSEETFVRVAIVALGEPSAVQPGAVQPGAVETGAVGSARVGPIDGAIADALWQVLGPRSERGVSAAQARALGANLRPWSLQRDSLEAGRAVLAHEGKDGAARVFARARTLTKRPEILKQIDDAAAVVLK